MAHAFSYLGLLLEREEIEQRQRKWQEKSGSRSSAAEAAGTYKRERREKKSTRKRNLKREIKKVDTSTASGSTQEKSRGTPRGG